MPSTASQVEVQAPPGLENVGSHLMPGEAGAVESTPNKSEQEMKEELVREVTAACKEHVETRTAAAVENLWQRGQKAMQYMQQQHMAQTEQLQNQLAACAESYRNLERENQVLRSGLEALMKHLTALFGAPPHIPQAPLPSASSQSPFFPAAAQAPKSSSSGKAFVPPPAPTEAPPPAPLTSTPRAVPAPGTMDEDFHTPISGSPTQAAVTSLRTPTLEATEELVSAPAATPQDRSSYSTTSSASPSLDAAAVASASGGTGCEPPTPAMPPRAEPAVVPGFAGGAPPPAPTFTLTLRRADTVPVGLDVQGEDSYLLVERVRPGGAVEAWNRQCPGDLREIRAGDHIININGAEDPEAMRNECLTKHLLKITVRRGSSSPVHVPLPNNMYLRADADEFVPQVGRA
eukprot:gb/GFBE01079006.1/.p1 GENE.gb/GFBE01079006.1/~~gb/GFBE01079006.1/.p1  ORF type:complete len:404 (+),score=70.47 gb/GFBE01079006.1/:1-1212(+)